MTDVRETTMVESSSGEEDGEVTFHCSEGDIELNTRRISSASGGQAASDGESSSDSTCTILNQNGWLGKKSSQHEQEQILSINNLPNIDPNDLEEDDDDDVRVVANEEESELVEIDLNEEPHCKLRTQKAGSSSSITNQQQQARESVQGEEMFAGIYRQDEEPCNPMVVNNQLLSHQQQQQQLYHHPTQQENYQFRGFGEAQPKLSFASQRMKEYFESFKSRRGGGETVRLYQFFKSTRTELVACLLFSLITSQALIVLRTNLNTKAGQQASWPSSGDGLIASWSQGIHNDAPSAHHQPPDAAQQQQQQVIGSAGDGASRDSNSRPLNGLVGQILNGNSNSNNPVIVHLASGLVMSFTVASLTQVFGHISGCHLIPSISLALYIKGHISRARLASYLGAQLVGSGLGVSLLSLLSSSQISHDEYRDLLLSSVALKYPPPPPPLEPQAYTFGSSPAASAISLNSNNNNSGRSKRDTAGSSSSKPPPPPKLVIQDLSGSKNRRGRAFQSASEDDINLALSSAADSQGSETILLSIMEQQRQLRADNKREALEGSSQPKTITAANASTYFQGAQVAAAAAAASSPEALGGGNLEAKQASPTSQTLPASLKTNGSSLPAALSAKFTSEQTPLARDSQTVGTSDEGLATNDGSRVQLPSPALTSLHIKLEDASKGLPATSDQQASSTQPSVGLIGANLPTLHPDDKRVKLRRRKRNKQQQQGVSSGLLVHTVNNGSSSTLSANNNNSKYYINLLEFTLPEQIMSSESIRQCIDKQLSQLHLDPPGLTVSQTGKTATVTRRNKQQQQQQQEVLQSLATKSFGQCLSLSNSSQMFVFQFMATLLVVLTYLVNVDPRRVDLGFKSLSIGLAYFVASILTVHSGGFYPNPFHLLFLNWLAPTSEWRSEWFIYLITPLISGLFGAISHEYIDFSSLRNRNKQLHLRRSFYSLDNLPQIVAATSSGRRDQSRGNLMATVVGRLENSGGLRSASHATVLEIAESGSSSSSTSRGGRRALSSHAATEKRHQQLSSSSSLESARSRCSIISLNGGSDPAIEPLEQPTGPLASMAPISIGEHHLSLHLNLQQQQHLSCGSNHYSNIPQPATSSNSGNSSSSNPNQQPTGSSGSESFGTNRKLISYSRQLRMEQQRAARQLQQQQQPLATSKQTQQNRTSLRRSDFDSNFLISSSCSSPPTATRRQIHTSGWM